MSESDLFDRLAIDIFIADGGVDDHELMTDQELKAIVAWWLRAHAEDDVFLSLVVRASREGVEASMDDYSIHEQAKGDEGIDEDRTVTIMLPYNLKIDQVQLDPASRAVKATVDLWKYDEDELRRIITSAAVLLNETDCTVAEALDTAVIWERG